MDPGPAIDAALTDILSIVSGPYHLFGHSLGGQLAYQVTRHAAAIGAPGPVSLQISSARPFLGTGISSSEQLTAADAIDLVRKLGGVPEDLIDNEHWQRFALPILVADLRLSARFAEFDLVPVDVPLTVHGGLSDPLVTEAMLCGWSQVSAPLDLRMHPGGHFYLTGAPEGVVTAVLDVVERMGSEGGTR